ncbi:AAA family ATPase [Catellatospora coxensis]
MEADRSDLVDRTAEREQLCAAARRAAAGHGNAVILEGSIGLGKSTLLDHLAEDCAALGMRVLHGAAADVEQRLPFAAVSAVARAHLGRDDDLDRVTALLRGRDALARSVTAVHHELAVTEELLALADRWLSRGPVAILLDDAQWADASSMVLLHRLARDIAQVPLLLVVAARAMAPGEALTALQRGLLARGALELRLEPLPEPAVVALARAQLGAQPGQRLRRLLRAHGGNPLHVKTLLRAYRADGLIQVADGAADLAGSADPPAVPQSLIELARGQAAQMPREYRETLQAAAVLGQTVDVAELSTVLEQPLMAVSEVIADALGTGLLVDDGHGLRFRQGLTRELLDRSVPQSVRTALHQRAGRMLTGRDGAPERVAAHLLAGGALGEDGLGWLAAHADALTVRAPTWRCGCCAGPPRTRPRRARCCVPTWCGLCSGTASPRRPNVSPARCCPPTATPPGRRTCAGCWCRPATGRDGCRRRSTPPGRRWTRPTRRSGRPRASAASPRPACSCWTGSTRRWWSPTAPSRTGRRPATPRRSGSATSPRPSGWPRTTWPRRWR